MGSSNDLVYLFAFGLGTGTVSYWISRAMKTDPRRQSDNYFFIGFAAGVILWTLQTSFWAGVSNMRRLEHLPLDAGDRAWCFLYDHLVVLSVVAGLLVAVGGETIRSFLRKRHKEQPA
jgi:hypothetical protein